MEDIVQIRLLFVVGLLVMSGVAMLLASATARVGELLRARAERARRPVVTRRTVPARGTR